MKLGERIRKMRRWGMANETTCWRCGGTSWIDDDADDEAGTGRAQKPCPVCGGTGRLPDDHERVLQTCQ